jgi:hypothetical protein
MQQIIKENPGPFSSYLSKQSRSDKLKKKHNIIKMDNIKIVKGDKSNKITLNRTVSDLIQDSDDDIESDNNSISTAEPVITPINKKDKIKKPIPMMPQINQDQFNYFINNKKTKPNISKEDKSESESEDDNESEIESNCTESETESLISKSSSRSEKVKMSKREIEKKKQEILIKLLALEKKGVTLTKTYSLKSSLDELEFEYETQKNEAEIEASIHFQQKILMAAVTGIEFLNNKFDPINAKLDGWSETVMDNIVDYEDIFRKLHEKYKSKADMPPELQLLVTLVGSGFMFHLTQSLFKTSLPGLGDVLKSNPDIMSNIMGAMGQTMNQQQSNINEAKKAREEKVESTSKPDMTGPSLNLGDLFNQFTNPPPNPVVQQAPKQKDDSDRFSVASSSNNSDVKSIAVSNTSRGRGRGKGGYGKGKGKSITIN